MRISSAGISYCKELVDACDKMYLIYDSKQIGNKLDPYPDLSPGRHNKNRVTDDRDYFDRTFVP